MKLANIAVIVVVTLVVSTSAWADEDRLPTAAIQVHLRGDGTWLFPSAKYGRRTVQLQFKDDFEMRVMLSRLLGEPIQKYTVRTPQVHEVVFEADAGYANRVSIRSIGDDRGDNQVSESHGFGRTFAVHVSQDVIDRIATYDFTFSLRTIPLDRLPNEFYSGANDQRRQEISKISSSATIFLSSSNRVHIHLPVTGVLPPRPGVWSWDLPGSPGWEGLLSSSNIPLGEGEHEVPEDHRLTADASREAFRRMLYLHHVERKALFEGNSGLPENRFRIQNLRVSATDMLRVIYEQRPEVYAIIMEREAPAAKDAELLPLIAGASVAYAEALDEQGFLGRSAELERRGAAADRAIAAAGSAVSEDLRQEWSDLRQRYVDATFERRLAGLGRVLSDIDDSTVGSVTDSLRRQVARLARDAEGKASPRLLQQIRSIERLVNLKPKARKVGEQFRDCAECPLMVVVPAGSYMMGSPASEHGRTYHEGPPHRVTIAKPFAVGVYEVTFAGWDACERGGGCHNVFDEGWGARSASGDSGELARRATVRAVAVAAERGEVSTAERGGVGVRGASRYNDAVSLWKDNIEKSGEL